MEHVGFVLRADAFEIAGRRVTRAAPAGAIEVRLACFRIPNDNGVRVERFLLPRVVDQLESIYRRAIAERTVAAEAAR